MILELVSEKFSTLTNLIFPTDPGVAELRRKKIVGDLCGGQESLSSNQEKCFWLSQKSGWNFAWNWEFQDWPKSAEFWPQTLEISKNWKSKLFICKDVTGIWNLHRSKANANPHRTVAFRIGLNLSVWHKVCFSTQNFSKSWNFKVGFSNWRFLNNEGCSDSKTCSFPQNILFRFGWTCF